MGLGQIYHVGNTAVHRADARVKILALLAFSVAIFFMGRWWQLALFAAAVLAAIALARIPLVRMGRMCVPLFVLAGFSVLFNVVAHPGVEGLSSGAFFGVRMVVLVAASFVVCLTTSASDLLRAFEWFLGPLRRLRVPVDDIAFTLALSVRFIPVIEREFLQIRAAQLARGAQASGSLWRTLQVWGSAFGALFVGLFRHADNLATAMDARCYGCAPRRTRLPK